jgi:hypothetical protein
MRANGPISITPTARQRKWWVALALVAITFLSLRPACEVWLSHRGHHQGAHVFGAHLADAAVPAHAPAEPACCATIEKGGLVKPADMLIARPGESKAPVVVLVARNAMTAVGRLVHILTTSVRPLGSPPFHVRSARILR